MAEQSRQHVVPKWLQWLGVVLALAGAGVSFYLTIAHYTTSVVLACPENSIVNCAKVTTSLYSKVFGVPLALLGLLFFIAMVPVQLPIFWQMTQKWLIWGRLAFAGSGVLMIFWLIYVELFKLNAICLYCTAVHVITIALFALTAVGTAIALD